MDERAINYDSEANVMCINSVDNTLPYHGWGECCRYLYDSPIFEINPNSLQEWDGQNEYGNTYYYPVLPKFDRFGQFDETLGLQNGNTPFGSTREWNEDDTKAYITNDISDNSLLIDIIPETIDINVFDDVSGIGNVGIGIGDYKVDFDVETDKPKKKGIISKIRKNNKGGAF